MASAPETSTPVAPPPTTANVSHSSRDPRVARSLRLLEHAVDAVAQLEGVAKRLQAARGVLPFVVAEVGRLGATGDDQAVVVERLATLKDHLPALWRPRR